MKRHIDAGTLVCRHCAQPVIDDNRSPTGLVHAATRRARCDGKSRRQAPWSNRDRMAVAA